MIRVNMIAHGQEVKGQGVGSAYFDLVKLLTHHTNGQIQLNFNDDRDCHLNHVHTIDPRCYWQMQTSKLPSCMHVHFLPETMEGSIKMPRLIQKGLYRYFMSMYRRADELIVVNPIFIEPLTQYGIDRERITYIPNVVSSEEFFSQSRNELVPTYDTYNLDPTKFTVLSVGQVQTRKGVVEFIEIAEAMPEVQFVWAGGFSFGKITDGYEKLQQIIQNPPKNVHFIGIVDREDMNDLYNIADVYLTTSYNELFPMAILEAVNAGVPIVVRDLALYEQIYFTDYARATTVDEFVNVLQQLQQPEHYAQAKEASAKIAYDYSEANVAQLWRDYYQGFVERHPQ